MKDVPIGTLIGRIGAGPSFVVGDQLHSATRSGGALILQANDSIHADNSGYYAVKVCRSDPGLATGVSSSFVVGTAFALWAPGNFATTYRPLVPAGSGVNDKATVGGGRTPIDLNDSALIANRTYGAHAHTNKCGATPASAGPHHQDNIDPVAPSVEPDFANPSNELWLDFTTDRSGAATSTAAVGWEARGGGAQSITIHEQRTDTHAGHAGTAGARLACIDVNFNPGA